MANSGFVYHVGYLPEDRRQSKKLDVLAAAYLKQARLGLVCLTQRRINVHHYEYYAIPTRDTTFAVKL